MSLDRQRSQAPPPARAAPTGTGRFQTWLERRLPRADQHLPGQRNTYILPTGSGVLFAVVLLVLLVASINYQLSLGYALTFLLAGSAGASMYMTHATLQGVRLQLRTGGPAFAGSPAEIEITLHSPGATRHGIGLGWRHQGERAWTDVPARGMTTVHLHLLLPARGWHALPAIVAETRFPMGLFRAWTVWRPAAQMLAWPKPEQPAPPLPTPSSWPAAEAGRPAPARAPAPLGAQQAGEVAFEGVRPWRTGDAVRHVAWKKVARTGELATREAESHPYGELWLDEVAAHSAHDDIEHRLSRLAAWVLAAEHVGRPVGLELGSQRWLPARGDAHRRALLDALGSWGEATPGAAR